MRGDHAGTEAAAAADFKDVRPGARGRIPRNHRTTKACMARRMGLFTNQRSTRLSFMKPIYFAARELRRCRW